VADNTHRATSPDEWEKYVVQIPVVTLFLGEYERKRRPAGNRDYFKVKKEGFRPGQNLHRNIGDVDKVTL